MYIDFKDLTKVHFHDEQQKCTRSNMNSNAMSTWMWMYTKIHLHTLFEPPLGNSRGRAETNQDIIPRANQHPNENGARGASEQLLRAPKVPKSRHLGRPIYLNSTSKFEVELALKKWPRPGSIFSDDSVTVITSVLINENIDPGRGPFF